LLRGYELDEAVKACSSSIINMLLNTLLVTAGALRGERVQAHSVPVQSWGLLSAWAGRATHCE